jgi:hypothetical protein
MFSLFSNSGKRIPYTHEFIVDSSSDIANHPNDVKAGSLAFVINDSTYYMMNHNNTWVKINVNSGSGGGGNDTPSEDDEIRYDGRGV